jgi:hypothetical protein
VLPTLAHLDRRDLKETKEALASLGVQDNQVLMVRRATEVDPAWPVCQDRREKRENMD